MTTVEHPRRQGVFSLVKRLVGGFVTLARLEVTHGRQEIGQMLGSVKSGALFVGVALVLVLLAMIALVVFIVLGIAALLDFLPAWLVALLIMVVFLLLAGLFAFMAYRKLKVIGPPQETIDSVKEDIAWAKRLLKRE
jgi:uncharacterized membrane protein YqjE